MTTSPVLAAPLTQMPYATNVFPITAHLTESLNV